MFLYLCDVLMRLFYVRVYARIFFFFFIFIFGSSSASGWVNKRTLENDAANSLFFFRLCKARVNVLAIDWNGHNTQIIQSHSKLLLLFFSSSKNNAKKTKQKEKKTSIEMYVHEATICEGEYAKWLEKYRTFNACETSDIVCT